MAEWCCSQHGYRAHERAEKAEAELAQARAERDKEEGYKIANRTEALRLRRELTQTVEALRLARDFTAGRRPYVDRFQVTREINNALAAIEGSEGEQESCPTCKGTGHVPPGRRLCPTCRGTGTNQGESDV